MPGKAPLHGTRQPSSWFEGQRENGVSLPPTPTLLTSLMAGAPADIVWVKGLVLEEGFRLLCVRRQQEQTRQGAWAGETPQSSLVDQGTIGELEPLCWGRGCSTWCGSDRQALVEFTPRQPLTTVSLREKKTNQKRTQKRKSLCPCCLGSRARKARDKTRWSLP